MKTNETTKVLGEVNGTRVASETTDFGYDLVGFRYRANAETQSEAILWTWERALSQGRKPLDVRSVRRVAGSRTEWWVTLNVQEWKR